MQKIGLEQKQQQKLSSQQIQLINMLHQTQAKLEEDIARELTENPALEEDVAQETKEQETIAGYINKQGKLPTRKHGWTVDDVVQQQAADTASPHEELLNQFRFLQLGDHTNLIAEHIVGSLTAQGLLPHTLKELAEEIAILYAVDVSKKQIDDVLVHLKKLAPPGTAAKNLQACLAYQLEAKPLTKPIALARAIIKEHFEWFKKKHYTKIAQRLDVPLAELKLALDEISRLNPVPLAIHPKQNMPLEPHFDVHIEKGRPTVVMLDKRTPRLRVSGTYQDLLKQHKESGASTSKEVVAFIQANVNRAKWFIQALEKRKNTLLKIMKAIVTAQKDFFETDEIATLRPIFLKHIAEKINMDISTVSRAIHGKAVQVNGNVYPLKFFFSEAMPTTDGKQVSSRLVKKTMQEIIDTENKQHPYHDVELVEKLKDKGYVVSRRTVAKYREQLKLPVARLRREIV